ncbi:MAG: hypothetical protein C4583_02655 [Anaerolineaceae bacterium]|nr:MAG: hypothetical protein C4583_02655 [Anaerolineaceae bacterium]
MRVFVGLGMGVFVRVGRSVGVWKMMVAVGMGDAGDVSVAMGVGLAVHVEVATDVSVARGVSVGAGVGDERIGGRE